MMDDKERLLSKILDELKNIRRELERIESDTRDISNIKSEVNELKRKLR